MLSDTRSWRAERAREKRRLNAPYGARCFLTRRAGASCARHGAGLNAPYGARCFLTVCCRTSSIWCPLPCLNAPYGASFLTGSRCQYVGGTSTPGLNAPYGARCFLTSGAWLRVGRRCFRLNAPYGARCFLTQGRDPHGEACPGVLMHLMALGAF